MAGEDNGDTDIDDDHEGSMDGNEENTDVLEQINSEARVDQICSEARIDEVSMDPQIDQIITKAGVDHINSEQGINQSRGGSSQASGRCRQQYFISSYEVEVGS
jgi:hypothetical protein